MISAMDNRSLLGTNDQSKGHCLSVPGTVDQY